MTPSTAKELYRRETSGGQIKGPKTTYICGMNKLTTTLFILLFASPLFGQQLSDLSFGADSALEIATWNIERFPKRGQRTLDSAREVMKALDVDIWALQEIDDSNKLKQLVAGLNGYDMTVGQGYFGGLAYVYKTGLLQQVKVYKIYETAPFWQPLPRSPLVLEFVHNMNKYILINNHYKCCGNGVLDTTNSRDEEMRRLTGQRLIKKYIDSVWANERVVLLGDLNDILTDNRINNIFQSCIDDTSHYLFTDMAIAKSPSSNWSYPGWPSHLDHLMITDELFEDFRRPKSEVQVIKVGDHMKGGFSDYDYIISDHRPVALKLSYKAAETPQDSSGQDSSTSVFERMTSTFSFYPNPSNGQVHFRFEHAREQSKIDIVSPSGQVIETINLESGILTFDWNASHIPSGVYLLRWMNADALIEQHSFVKSN